MCLPRTALEDGSTGIPGKAWRIEANDGTAPVVGFTEAFRWIPIDMVLVHDAGDVELEA
jgi:hypothetical protein